MERPDRRLQAEQPLQVVERNHPVVDEVVVDDVGVPELLCLFEQASPREKQVVDRVPLLDLLQPELEVFIPAPGEKGHDIRAVARLPEYGLLPLDAPRC